MIAGRPRLLQNPLPPARRILIIFGVTAVFAVVCTLVTYFTEHHAQGRKSTPSSTPSSSPLAAPHRSSVANPATDLGKVWSWSSTSGRSSSSPRWPAPSRLLHARSKELNEEMEKASGRCTSRRAGAVSETNPGPRSGSNASAGAFDGLRSIGAHGARQSSCSTTPSVVGRHHALASPA